MLKSIATSKEALFYSNTDIIIDYSSVLNDLGKIDREINEEIKKYEDRQALSKTRAAQIRSR